MSKYEYLPLDASSRMKGDCCRSMMAEGLVELECDVNLFYKSDIFLPSQLSK